jgi:hypothetical protein
MIRYTLSTAVFLVAAMIGQDFVQAQMFGERTLGRPLSIQEGAAEMESAGTLTGRERFLRENRPATAFVGPDIRELQRFIGSLQAQVRGRVQPSTQGLRRRVDRSAEINQPLGPAPAGTPYNPELVVSYPAQPSVHPNSRRGFSICWRSLPVFPDPVVSRCQWKARRPSCGVRSPANVTES